MEYQRNLSLVVMLNLLLTSRSHYLWILSTTYHPRIDGQIERVNQVLEDMLRMYVMNQPGNWEDYNHLVEFAYNNNF